MSCAWVTEIFAMWGVSETIAMGALVVAGWAGWSAHLSAMEAKRANYAARFHERRLVFDAFFDLSMHMTQMGQRADMAVVEQFYRHVYTAYFCFDKALAEKLKTYFDACHAVADFSRMQEGVQRLPDDIQEKLRRVQQTSAPLLEELKEAVSTP